MWRPTFAFVNARVAIGGGIAGSLRFRSRILSVDERPRRGDTVVDLGGAFVLPGLINAHDHLELNHYGRLKFRTEYGNATEWIDDLRPRLDGNAAIREARIRPLGDRLFIGALKNLLSGVTTVVHHNPLYGELRRAMPIRILRRYGWAHSFSLQHRPAGAHGELGGDIRARCRATPVDVPFFVHLAEGVDADARGELPRLEALGCLRPNTVLVHGVAIDEDGWRRVSHAGAALVWCPASNEFLFGRTAAVRLLLDGRPGGYGRVAVGTDSRLTGSRDLLDELRVAHEQSGLPPAELLDMVTKRAAGIIREPGVGEMTVGASADLLVIPPGADNPAAALLEASRADISLVVVGGQPLVASPGLATIFHARRKTPQWLHVDGMRKFVDSALARQIADCTIAEPGVTVT
jgi:cytosine/adenosine deaminase-related metal-dependent hydrolase